MSGGASPLTHRSSLPVNILVDFRKKRSMNFHRNSNPIDSKGSFVEKLSLHDHSMNGLLVKLSAAWTSYFTGTKLEHMFAGLELGDVLTALSIVYVFLNIYVLLRDKVLRTRKEEAADERAESKRSSGE